METQEIKKGDLTNKGLVKMVDKEWTHKDGTAADVLVITTEGPFRMSELEKVGKASKPDPRPLKELVDFPTVMSLDIRPGVVKRAERVPKKDKLIKLVVDTSLGKKTVVTNLGGSHEPESFMHKTFMFVMNMPPAKIGGVVSEAMIMAYENIAFIPESNSWETFQRILPVHMPLDAEIL